MSRADRGATLSASPLRLAVCAGAFAVLLLPSSAEAAPTLNRAPALNPSPDLIPARALNAALLPATKEALALDPATLALNPAALTLDPAALALNPAALALNPAASALHPASAKAGAASALPPASLDAAPAAVGLAGKLLPRRTPRITPRQLALRHARARVRVVAFARAQRGDRYAYGASGPSSWDCSGLTRGTYRVVGIRLPHSSAAQARHGRRVTPRTARVGDLVAMRGHVGILVGRWRMVDAPGTGRRVTERLIYRTSTLQFRRLIG